MAATIRDIKEKTGLSLATISKYINGGNVRPENRVKIEAAIAELHYEVNEIARGLVTNKTRTIGVVMYSIESLFAGTMVHYIGQALRKKGYGLLICDSCNDEKVERDNIQFLVGKKVDGIILIPVSGTGDFLEPARRRNIPVVLLDRSVQGEEFDCVRIDNRKAAKQAAEAILQNSHEKIAVIYSGKEYTGIERYKGFCQVMRKAGFSIPEPYRKEGVHSIEHGYDSMKELLELSDKPTAVFMTNYEITLGAIMALQESEEYSLKDFFVMGFDNLLLTHLVDSHIYVVVQPMQELAESAAELLLNRIEGEIEGAPREMILGTTIQEANMGKKWKE